MPLVVALLAMPVMVKELGLERFGVLTLVWTVIGYFSLFDAGLGRALTKIAAEKLGAEQEQEIPGFIWTAFFIMGLLGVLGAMILGLVSPWLVLQVFKIPNGLREERGNPSCYCPSSFRFSPVLRVSGDCWKPINVLGSSMPAASAWPY